MFERLCKYQSRGHFTFMARQSLQVQCNAPTNRGGVYLIYREVESAEALLYIGSSGQRGPDGSIKVRKSGLGGMKDRIVNGYHPKFGKIKRKTAFPRQMRKEGISQLEVFWWVTFSDLHQDFPTDVEGELMSEYRECFGKEPPWHV